MRRFFVRWFFPKGNIHKKNDNQQERIHERNIISNFSKAYHCFFDLSLKILAVINDNIPRINLKINLNTSSVDLIGSKFGSIKRIVSQAADKLTNKSESTSSQTDEKTNINLLLAYIKLKIISRKVINFFKKYPLSNSVFNVRINNKFFYMWSNTAMAPPMCGFLLGSVGYKLRKK